MASLRERMESVVGMVDGTVVVKMRPSDVRRVLALLAAAKRALHLVEENNEEVVKMVGSFGLYADLTAALAAFEEEQPRA